MLENTDDPGQIAPAPRRDSRLAASLLAFTAFCGSFLLFLVQPVVAKQLLPWFGGGAGVWATCLAFFQVSLLLGYAFADWLIHRIAQRRQLLLLALLLLIAVLRLPIIPAATWRPRGTESAALSMLVALAATVGLPFIAVASTSSLVQSWYAQRFAARSPYRLYALSNLASLLALLGYPLLLEPRLGTRRQALLWSAGYLLWAALMLVCGWRTRRWQAAAATPNVVRAVSDTPDPAHTAPTLAQQLRWGAFAALGSCLLVTVTNHLTEDVAAIPLLWILPLSVYLLTFIATFENPRWLSQRRLAIIGCAAVLIYVVASSYNNWPTDADHDVPLWVQILAYCLVLGGGCLLCHGTLVLTRPAQRFLTRFYLTLAVGGALGSTAIGLLAPAILPVDFDLDAVMLVSAGLVARRAWAERGAVRWFAVGVYAATFLAAGLVVQQFYDGTVLTRRNFYGTLRVYDWQDDGPKARTLSNGVTVHGTQYFGNDSLQPTEYYGPASGVAQAIATLRSDHRPLKIGVIGLGTGTLAAYGRVHDRIRFYEINAAVLDVAQHAFSFLRQSHAQIDVVLGDARLSLEREPPQAFDLLVVDAFSSDAIPVHLLTREALQLYLRHLKPGAILAFHTSNRYVDLAPVIARLAEEHGLTAQLIDSTADGTFDTPSTWVLLSDGRSRRTAASPVGGHALGPNDTRPWTDDFSDLLPFLR